MFLQGKACYLRTSGLSAACTHSCPHISTHGLASEMPRRKPQNKVQVEPMPCCPAPAVHTASGSQQPPRSTSASAPDSWQPVQQGQSCGASGWKQSQGETPRPGYGDGYGRRTPPRDADGIEALGRQLTAILRHRALDYKLHISSDGYVDVAELLKLHVRTRAGRSLSSHTLDDVRKAVVLDTKQRFGLLQQNGKLFIRANQGHSLQAVRTEDLLKPILSAEQVPVCVHGTYRQHLSSIFKEGLKRMNRLHVHFATGLPKSDGVISGMRTSCNVLIHLDVEKAVEDGMKLFISENGVILTEGISGVVPTRYFKKVESLPGRKEILIPDRVV